MSDLPYGWERLRLGKIAARTSNVDPSRSPQETFELYSVPSFATGAPDRAKGEEIKSSKQSVQPDDVLLCKIVPHLNRVWTVGPNRRQRQIASSEWIVYRDHYCEPHFLRYCLSEASFREQFMGTVAGVGGSLMRARPTAVSEIEIPLAPAAEQRRIVAKIDFLSGKSYRARDHLDHIPRLVDQYRQAILAAAFCGELTRKWRKFQSERLSPWTTKTWANAGITLNGRAFPSSEYGSHGVKLLRPGNLHESGRVEWNAKNTRFLPSKYAKEFPRYFFRGSELIINLTAQSLEDAFLGRVCLSSGDDEFLLNQRIALFRPHEMDRKYCLYVLKSPSFRTFVDGGLNAGSLIQHIHTKQLMNFVFPIAPVSEQKEIVRRIEKAFSWINRLAAEAANARKLIDHLDQAILTKAFHGELVPRDPDDEPASVLLEHISSARPSISSGARSKKSRR